MGRAVMGHSSAVSGMDDQGNGAFVILDGVVERRACTVRSSWLLGALCADQIDLVAPLDISGFVISMK
jgi:hypothetical protein